MIYYLFILAIGAKRLVELVVSRHNARWSFAQGGREFGRGHYPVMVGMHTLLLVSCIVEVATMHRPFLPWLGWPMVAEVAALPLVHSAWMTAIVFSIANALVLTVRIRAENVALGYA